MKHDQERVVARISAASSQAISAIEIEEMYDYAADGIRELGKATVTAQLRSIEILRAHACQAATRTNELSNGSASE